MILGSTRWWLLTIDLYSPTVTMRLPSSRERILATGVSLFKSFFIAKEGVQLVCILLDACVFVFSHSSSTN